MSLLNVDGEEISPKRSLAGHLREKDFRCGRSVSRACSKWLRKNKLPEIPDYELQEEDLENPFGLN